MPKVNWGIPAGTVDDWDRSTQYTPYDGPIPPNGVYLWLINRLIFVAPTEDKFPQLRIGLQLQARTKEEKRYQGYPLLLFRSISDRNPMFWVPFLDAIGVSENEFRQRTIADQDGNIKKIGAWGNDGKQTIKGLLKDDNRDGQTRKDIGWMGAADEKSDDEEDEDWEDSQGYDDPSDDEGDEGDEGDDDW